MKLVEQSSLGVSRFCSMCEVFVFGVSKCTEVKLYEVIFQVTVFSSPHFLGKHEVHVNSNNFY